MKATTVRIPATVSVRRRWALEIALGLLDLIRARRMRHSLFAYPDGRIEIVRFHPEHNRLAGDLVGVYDERAQIADIVDDLLETVRKEPVS